MKSFDQAEKRVVIASISIRLTDYLLLAFTIAFGILAGLLMKDAMDLHLSARRIQHQQTLVHETKAPKPVRDVPISRPKVSAEKSTNYAPVNSTRSITVERQVVEELKRQCDQAHTLMRKRPSRETTLMADKVCSAYEAERQRLQ